MIKKIRLTEYTFVVAPMHVLNNSLVKSLILLVAYLVGASELDLISLYFYGPHITVFSLVPPLLLD